MATSIFDEKAITPNDEMLKGVLDDTVTLWNELLAVVNEKGIASGEWKFYSKKAGWCYVVKREKRTFIYLIPQHQYFKANFVFGEKAVSKSKTANLPDAIIRTIENATPYTEGRSFMIDIKSQSDVESAKILLQIKEDN